MEGSIFDMIARRFSAAVSRRGALRAIGGVAVGSLGVAITGDEAAAYSSTCRRFILSGGKRRGKEIDVDDDLTVYVDGEAIFEDEDRKIGNNLVAIEPIKFKARVGDKLRIVATDGQGPCRSLSQLWLHCKEGGEPRRLTRGVAETCVEGRPADTFFDKTFRI